MTNNREEHIYLIKDIPTNSCQRELSTVQILCQHSSKNRVHFESCPQTDKNVLSI